MSHNKHLQLKLVTPVQVVFEQPVLSVSLPTVLGEITVLPHHAALVSVLKPGQLLVKTDTEEFPLAVAGGLLEVFNNTLVVLADSAEHATAIDIAAAEAEASRLAKELEAETKLDLSTYSLLQRNLEMAKVRIAVGSKWRHLKK